MNSKQLREQADRIHTERVSLITRWQEIGDHFYPERANYTITKNIGDQFADHLMTSYPIQCRRELGDQIGMMSRPTQKTWFHQGAQDKDRENHEAKQWLEWANNIQRRAMYDRNSMFTRAMKEADHDFAAFGQDVPYVRLNKNRDGLLYKTYHLRDVAWMENEEGKISFIARKWKPTIRELHTTFGNRNHQMIGQEVGKHPFQTVDCYHIVCEADFYDDDARGKPYWSLYYDINHEHLIEAVPVFNKGYCIGRWQTVSGSQYAFSPATIVALPDARLIQAMTYTLLEAGEKAARPPVVATKDAVKSDIELFSGGVTWVSEEYDERLGSALRPLEQDLSGLPIGLDMMQDTRALLKQAFFLNKLSLPERTADMTAYEVGQRVQEYIRGAMPIFEPMEQERNGQICEETFDILLRNGAFGSPYDMPESLQGAEIEFRFESPLHDLIEQQKGQKFMEMKGLILEAAQLDQSTIAIPDMDVSIRDVLKGIQVPTEWIRSEVAAEEQKAAMQAVEETAQLLAGLEQGGKGAASLAKANRDLVEAG